MASSGFLPKAYGHRDWLIYEFDPYYSSNYWSSPKHTEVHLGRQSIYHKVSVGMQGKGLDHITHSIDCSVSTASPFTPRRWPPGESASGRTVRYYDEQFRVDGVAT